MSVQAEKKPMNYETDIAVLQVEVRNLSEKVDEHTKTTQQMLREYHAENNRQHGELFTRIVKLENWRWMLMGAGVVLGMGGMMGIEKVLGIH
jgi:hypothetical protein